MVVLSASIPERGREGGREGGRERERELEFQPHYTKTTCVYMGLHSRDMQIMPA